MILFYIINFSHKDKLFRYKSLHLDNIYTSINMELLLHYVWKHRLFPLKQLTTVDGKSLEIIDTGIANNDAGPDFFNAKIKIEGVLWVGNVEIHERTSDWKRHHHDTDCAYDSVILHVASDIDDNVYRTDGEPIPQMELHYPDYLLEHYNELVNSAAYPPCYKIVPSLSKLLLHSWMNSLQVERLEQKTHQISARLKEAGGNWPDAFFVTLARNFGFGTNSDAFEIWAKSIPLRAVDKHRDDLKHIEAIFFGQAGLLENAEADEYVELLTSEYNYLKHVFGMKASDNICWKLMRMRPGNFPHVRIAQLANIYFRSQGLFSVLMELDTIKSIHDAILCGTSPYWDTHYVFGEVSPRRVKSMSNSSIDLIIINTVVPFLYAYGKYTGSEKLISRAGRFLEELKAENNYITRMWKECGLEAEHAGDSQALIQLKKNYCDVRKCLFCRIGYEYFKKRDF